MSLPLFGRVPLPQLILLILWACLLYGGMLAPEQAGRNRRMPRWMRLGSSVVLVAAAWIWAFTGGRDQSVYRLALAVGMSLGTVGDFFLADMFRVRQPLVGGLAAFGVGHLAYLAAFAGILPRAGSGPALPLAIATMVIGTSVGWLMIVYPAPRSAPLRWGALGYALLLSSMAGLAIGLALSRATHSGLLLAVGATMFWLSDVILALRVFRGAHFHLLDDWVWLTYGTGQMLIVYSFAAIPLPA
jgi:uncharacterized membrane protein YhhN